MTNIDDYKDLEGKIDWKAYHQAQVDAGEKCEKCGAYILFGKGYRQTCVGCKELTDNTEEVTHSQFIRCPKCGRSENVYNDYCDICEEGEHAVCCPKCDYEFVITTHVTFTFDSPPMIQEEEQEESDDEPDTDA